MSKDQILSYLNGRYTVGGYVARSSDGKHLKVYDDVYFGLRLDYLNDDGKLLNFVEDSSCGVIRFKTNQQENCLSQGKRCLMLMDILIQDTVSLQESKEELEFQN